MANGIIDLGSQLSQIGDTFQQNTELRRQQAMRDAIGSARLPDGSIDFSKAAAIALQFGSPQTAAQLSGIANQQQQRTLQERGLSLQERQFQFQQQQAQEAARGYDYREVDDGTGGKTLVRIHKATGRIERPPIEGAQETPPNPFAFGKMNDEQSKAALYANRMFQAEQILSDPSVITAATSSWQRVGGAIAENDRFGILRDRVTTPEYQKFDQAQRDFINAVLRRESGAVISDAEFANARKQYFPQPGDSEQVLRQKAANRGEAIRGIAAGAGRSYVPPYLFDPTGSLSPNPAAQQRQQNQAPRPGAQQPTPRHIEALKANPQMRADFDAKFGPGAAARVLGQ